MIWKTRDGTEIEISNMKDSHILATIKMLRRGADILKSINAFKIDMAAEMMNGDMAQFSMQQDSAIMYDMDDIQYLESYVPQWNALIEEANKRGLIPIATRLCVNCNIDISHLANKNDDMCLECHEALD